MQKRLYTGLKKYPVAALCISLLLFRNASSRFALLYLFKKKKMADEEQPKKPPPIVKRVEENVKMPVCLIIVGMAGSGKTTLLAQLQRSMEEKTIAAENENEENEEGTITAATPPVYCVNLDPATLHVPYDVSIDIRDTVNYKEVMKQHNLGPNGAIMTSLNLFTTKFDQVLSILEKRAFQDTKVEDQEQKEQEAEQKEEQQLEYIIVDTPGQIEAFTWSASGTIISESLASAFPTVLCFVVDTVRCASNPNTFMSNMLYACSMFYRTRLPLVIVFNKNDVVQHDFAIEWMTNYEQFQDALDNAHDSQSMGFYSSLTRSLSLVLDEFYSNFAKNCSCGVSAVTGDGIDDFWKVVQYAAKHDFAVDYIQDLKNRIEEQQAKTKAIAKLDIRRLNRDLQEERGEEDG